MALHLVLVEKALDWPEDFPAMQVVAAREYLENREYFNLPNAKVINLCRSYDYLSWGYYCSLLAEARGHKVIPTVRTLRDLSRKAIYSLDIEELDDLLNAILAKKANRREDNGFTVSVFFGQCAHPPLQKLAARLFSTFSCPLLEVEFRHDSQWRIHSIRAKPLATLSPEDANLFIRALNAYTLRKNAVRRVRRRYQYDLAILQNPSEEMPPSNPEALAKFIKAGRKLGVDVDLITKRDYSRLAEYDALFIRETTAIEHYTYHFAKKAESEGIPVIDDPASILRCTNKVFLAELLKGHQIPTPITLILPKGAHNARTVETHLDYPVVLKIPDGSFSRGVYKANDRGELVAILRKLFKESDLLLAQEYLYTPYDWRIGILNGKPLFASKYFMSHEHWQIVRHDAETGDHVDGPFQTMAVEDAPPKVVKIALRAARLIGDGLYGVDLKETEKGRVVVIEVNDNPSLDDGVENAVLGDRLYQVVLEEFIRRMALLH